MLSEGYTTRQVVMFFVWCSSVIWLPIFLLVTCWYTKTPDVRAALITQWKAEMRANETVDVEMKRRKAEDAKVEASWRAAYDISVFNSFGQSVTKVNHYRLKEWFESHRQYKIDNVATEGFIEPDYVVVFSKITPQAGATETTATETTAAEENK